MTEHGAAPELDPRFDPIFQRGYVPGATASAPAPHRVQRDLRVDHASSDTEQRESRGGDAHIDGPAPVPGSGDSADTPQRSAATRGDGGESPNRRTRLASPNGAGQDAGVSVTELAGARGSGADLAHAGVSGTELAGATASGTAAADAAATGATASGAGPDAGVSSSELAGAAAAGDAVSGDVHLDRTAPVPGFGDPADTPQWSAATRGDGGESPNRRAGGLPRLAPVAALWIALGACVAFIVVGATLYWMQASDPSYFMGVRPGIDQTLQQFVMALSPALVQAGVIGVAAVLVAWAVRGPREPREPRDQRQPHEPHEPHEPHGPHGPHDPHDHHDADEPLEPGGRR